MSILSWLQQTLAGKQPVQMHFAAGEEEFAGLNLKEALEAHLQWKDRLTALTNDPQAHRPDPKQVAADQLCALGKWLYGRGKQEFGHLKEYEQLRQTHIQFHTTAAAVIRFTESEQQAQATQLLRGPFRALSNDVQLHLISLYSAAHPK